MSTYTDLHNRIKENLTILRRPGSLDDGITPQRVIFINPENQFYGTFNGTMNVSGGTLSDLQFKGGAIDGAIIKDATFLDGSTPVQIGELAAASQEHEEKISVLEEQTGDLSAKQGTISASVDQLRLDLKDIIKEEIESLQDSSGTMSDDIEALSDGLSGIISALSLDLGKLSASSLDHVVFHGDMVLTQTKYDRVGDLFQKVFCRCFGVATPVANGTLYRIVFDYDKIPKTQKKVIVTDEPGSAKHIELGNGDYILVKNHDKSKKNVDPMTMVGDDISIVVQDLDFVRSEELCRISSLLSSDHKSIVGLIGEVSASAITSSLGSANQYTDDQIEEVYLCAIVSSHSDSVAICEKLSADLSTALTSEISSKYVHLTGDHVNWIDSDSISAENLHAKSLVVDSSDLVSIRTKDGIVLSGDALSVQTGHGFEDVVVNGRSLASTFNEKLDIQTASEISSKLALSNDVDQKLSNFNDQLSIYYDKDEKKIWVGGRDYRLANSIDASDFVKDGILSTVELCTINGSPTLVFSWNTDAKITTTRVNVSSLVDVYKASGDGIILSDGHTFYLDFDKVARVDALTSTEKDLSELSDQNASQHKYLLEQIDNISVDSFRKLVFDGHLKYSQICAYTTVEDFFTDSGYFQESQLPDVKNGAVFDIEFDPQIKNGCISVENISICDGDVLVVHDHRNTRYVGISSLTFNDGEPSKKNAYLFKVGVSRYDLDTQISKKSKEISDISTWLNIKFEYQDEDGLSVKTNAFFESGATVSSSLSVGEDLSVDKNLFVRERITSFDIDANGISSNYLSSNLISSNYLSSNYISSNYLSSNAISAGELTVSFNKIHDNSLSSKTLQDVHDDLSSTIDKKIFAGDYNEEQISNLSTDSLSILRIGRDEFAEKILNGNTSLSDKILYVVSSDNLNFYGERGVNLADPQDLSDATNKKYVDNKFEQEAQARKEADQELRESISEKANANQIPTKISQLDNDSNYLTEHQSLSAYYTKAKTDEAISSALSAKVDAKYIESEDGHQRIYGNGDVRTLSSVPGTYGPWTDENGNVDETWYVTEVSSGVFIWKNDVYGQSSISWSSYEEAENAKKFSTNNGTNWTRSYTPGQQIQTEDELALKSDIPTNTSQLFNDSNLLSATKNADGYYNIDVNKAYKAVTDTDGNWLTATYATKTELTNASSNLSNDYTDLIKNLSDKIDKKIYIEDKISSTSCYSDLQIIKLLSNEYQDLVVSGATSPSVLYVVESDFINAYGQQIKNLSSPELSSDAATKAYVDDKDSATKGYVDDRFNRISSNRVISDVFNSISEHGVSGITLDQSICAIYELVKILGYGNK